MTDVYLITVEYEVPFSRTYDKVRSAKDVREWIKRGGDLGLDMCSYRIKKISMKVNH